VLRAGQYRPILLLYAVTMFVGATLLFVVQPMAGKMILPLLGGTPAVWSTCMVFFQAALLAGYAYAHATAARLPVRAQTGLHVVLLLLPLAVLPLGVDAARLRGGEASPVLDVLTLLSFSVGLPFFAVSATAPLLQRWFAHTGHRAAADPYFLYAASNAGSMLALLGYPTLIEPWLPLRGRGWQSQTGLWTLGYILLVGLIVLCAVVLWRDRAARGPRPALQGGSDPESIAPTDATRVVPPAEALGWGRRLRWIALSFVPSSLLLGVTTYATTDIAAVPLLWVLPLAIYLLTFILAFGHWPAWIHALVRRAAFPTLLVGLFLVISAYRPRLWLVMLLHFALLYLVALACHGELALDRPSTRHLTEFYLLISVGGALGGLFNALVAPAVFDSLAEYPLAMVLACMLLLRRRPGGGRGSLTRDLVFLVVIVALTILLDSDTVRVRADFSFMRRALGLKGETWSDRLDLVESGLTRVLVYGTPVFLAATLRRRPMLLGVALASALAVVGFADARKEDQIRQARSFFGVVRISRDTEEEGGYIELRHGTTLHGRQSLDPKRRAEPISYYHRGGPVSQLFDELDKRSGSLRMGVIGLGTGTLAAYARPGDAVTFYEIDRLIRDIAFDPKYFTYVTDARTRGVSVRVELGDARVRLDEVRRERPGERYDVIAVDAFSSDAIPVHLLTREALRLYLEMLKPDGVIAVHISNRYLDLEPVVAALAADAALGGRLIQHDESAESAGAARSTWVVLARTEAALGALARSEKWTETPLAVDPKVGVWTDDFHNLLAVFKWK
jgi:hypothetical protein